MISVLLRQLSFLYITAPRPVCLGGRYTQLNPVRLSVRLFPMPTVKLRIGYSRMSN